MMNFIINVILGAVAVLVCWLLIGKIFEYLENSELLWFFVYFGFFLDMVFLPYCH